MDAGPGGREGGSAVEAKTLKPATEEFINQVILRMESQFRDYDVQLGCCKVLTEWARLVQNRSLLAKYGCLSTLMYSVRVNLNSKSDILAHLITAIRTLLLETPANKKLVMDEGILTLIVTVMDTHKTNPAIQAASCALLWTTSFNNAQFQEKIVSEGGLRAIISAMVLAPNHAVLQGHGCGALWNLCFKNEANKAQVAKTGLACIVGAMRRHPHDHGVQSPGVGTLYSLASSPDEAVKKCISRMPGMKAVLQAALQNHQNDAAIQSNATLVLSQMVLPATAPCVRVTLSPQPTLLPNNLPPSGG